MHSFVFLWKKIQGIIQTRPMFHAIFIVKHVEKIVATLMLNYCNICRSVRFFFIKKSRCLYGSIIELKISKYRYIIYNITCGGITGQACCEHLGPQGMFRWLMTTIIVTNEFVQLNRSLSLIWSYVKRGPSISLFKKAISVFNSIICQD